MRKDRRESPLSSPAQSELCGQAEVRPKRGPGAEAERFKKGLRARRAKKGNARGTRRRKEGGGEKKARAAQTRHKVRQGKGESVYPDHGRLPPQRKLAGLSPPAAAALAAGGIAQREDPVSLWRDP